MLDIYKNGKIKKTIFFRSGTLFIEFFFIYNFE